MYKRPVSVLVLIFTPQHRVLLLERAAHPGYWQSVTGSQEADDVSLRATAIREVWEETGIDATTPEHYLHDWQESQTWEIFPQWRHRYAPGVTQNTEHLFSLCLPAERPIRLAAAEHRAYQWLDYQAAAAKCFSPSNREAILRLPDSLHCLAAPTFLANADLA